MNDDEGATPTFARGLRRGRTLVFAIGAVWVWQAVLALVAAWPAATLVRAAFAGDPEGDARLWRSGSYALLGFLARDLHGVRAAIQGAAVVFAVGAFAGLVPLAALLVAVADAIHGPRQGSLTSLGARSLRFVPALSVLLVVFALAQATLIGIGLFVGSLIAGATHDGLGEARSEQWGAAVAIVFGTSAVFLGVAHDLARAALVRRRFGTGRALAAGVRTLRAHPVALPWSWGWRAALSLVPIAGVAMIATPLDRHRGLAVFLFLAVVHQAVVLLRLAFRASWFAQALRAVATFETR